MQSRLLFLLSPFSPPAGGEDLAAAPARNAVQMPVAMLRNAAKQDHESSFHYLTSVRLVTGGLGYDSYLVRATQQDRFPVLLRIVPDPYVASRQTDVH